MSIWKNKKFKLIVLFLSFTFCALSFSFDQVFAQPISSSQLIDAAQHYDGKTIVFSGEVIGDVMVRGEFAWVNVHDGQQAIGIWMPKKLAETILYTGSYKAKGDWIEVVGVFSQACREHHGEFDIHATSLKRVHSGYIIPRVFNRDRMKKAMILLAVLGGVWILRQLIKI